MWAGAVGVSVRRMSNPFKPVPTAAPSHYDAEQAAYDPEQAVLQQDADTITLSSLGPTLYEYKNRPRRDVWAMIVYLGLMGATFIGSLVSFGTTNSNALHGLYSTDFYTNSTSCDIKTFNEVHPDHEDTAGTFGYAFAASTGIWLPLSLVVGVIVSIGYLYLFRNHAVKMVYASFVASVAICFIIAVVSFASGSVASGIILVIVGVVYAVIMWFIRDQLQLVGKLLAVAGKGLQECPGIIISAIIVKVVGILIMVFLFAGMLCAGFVGKAVTNPARMYVSPGDVGYCLGPASTQAKPVYVDCCTYETPSWAVAQMVIASIAISWTAQLLLQVKLYIVADTMAQWYFRPEGRTDPYLVPSAKRAARNALTSSFGSLCFSSAILAIIDVLRKAMNNAQNNAEGWMKLICCILNCFAQCLLELLEQFTRFATIATAITGEAFIPAATEMFHVLKRNFLATFSLWWIPDFVLGMSCFIISMTWAGIVFFATFLQWKENLGSSNAVGVAFLVGFIGWLAFGFILYFLASIMLDGVNSIYICFSLDRDRKLVTHAEIHEIYTSLPTLQGAVIQQPGGEVAYGAPTQPPPQQHAQGYSAVALTPQQHSYGGYPVPQPGYGGYPATSFGQPGYGQAYGQPYVQPYGGPPPPQAPAYYPRS